MKKNALNIKDIQSVALDVLKKIAIVCESEGIRYTLAYGTLIGAVRHNGFIPWDDDVDIMMPRPDYERFLSLMELHPIENLTIKNFNSSSKYIYGITRVCDSRYHIVEEKFEDCGMGIFVDVYPIDGLGNTLEEATDAYSTSIGLADIIIEMSRKDIDWWDGSKTIMYRIKRFWRRMKYRFRGVRYYLNILQEYSKSKPFETTKYVGCLNWSWLPLCYEREWFDHLMKVRFEDTELFVVQEYDKMLRMQYGDYMKMPPIEQRLGHHCYSAYKI